ncbi:MAG: hypothetical protein ACKO5H_02110 [Candidatus Fonsibacter sp.]|jgi:hypothetical protein
MKNQYSVDEILGAVDTILSKEFTCREDLEKTNYVNQTLKKETKESELPLLLKKTVEYQTLILNNMVDILVLNTIKK